MYDIFFKVTVTMLSVAETT